MSCVMIRGLGHRRFSMLKSYFFENILQIFLKYVFFPKKWICLVKSNYSKITLPTSVCFISQINIMHEYTETESKYTGTIAQSM